MNGSDTFTLVTGASSGIGKAIAYEFARRHHHLLLVSLPGQGLGNVADDLHDVYGVRTAWFETDLSLSDGPRKVYEWTRANNYTVQYLVNNAGMAGTMAIDDSDDKYIDDRLQVNIRALVILCRSFIPGMKQLPSAGILNIASLSAFYSIPFKSIYAASKAFVVNFSRAIRTELKGTGISVSVVCPNGVRTNQGTYARIDVHGNKGRLVTRDKEQVARSAVDGLLKKKFMIIPGRLNYVLLFTSRFIPSGIKQNFLYREFSKEVFPVG